MRDFLTFEISRDGDVVEIHGDKLGLARLIDSLEQALRGQTHQHLFTPAWGGTELGEQKQGAENALVNHVKILIWPEE